MSVTVTQHISPGDPDPGTGIGAVSHMCEPVDIWLPRRAGHTRLLPESGEGRSQVHLGQITMQDPLRLSWVLGSSLGKWLLCFSLLINAIQEQPVLFPKSQSVAPTVAAGRWPHGLLYPSHSSTSPVWHPSAPTALCRPVPHPREGSKQHIHLQLESSPGVRFQQGFGVCSVSHQCPQQSTALALTQRPPCISHCTIPSASVLPLLFPKHAFGRTAVSKVVP